MLYTRRQQVRSGQEVDLSRNFYTGHVIRLVLTWVLTFVGNSYDNEIQFAVHLVDKVREI